MRGLALLLLLLWPTGAAAQTWTRDAGAGYANVSVSHLRGDRLYDRQGESRPLPTDYVQTSVGVYGEVGVVDRWLTLTLDGEVFRRNALEAQGATSGVGDLRLGAFSGLVTGPVVLTAGLLVKLPTGDERPAPGGAVAAVDRPGAALIAASLPTGEGAVVVEPVLRVGHAGHTPSWPLRHFVEAGVGWQARVDGADALTWMAKLGTQVPVTALDRVWWVLALSGLHSQLADDAPLMGGAGGLGEGVSYVSLSAQVHARVVGSAGVFGALSTAVMAERIISARPFQLGVFTGF